MNNIANAANAAANTGGAETNIDWLLLSVAVTGILLVCSVLYSARKINAGIFSDGDETQEEK